MGNVAKYIWAGAEGNAINWSIWLKNACRYMCLIESNYLLILLLGISKIYEHIEFIHFI